MKARLPDRDPSEEIEATITEGPALAATGRKHGPTKITMPGEIWVEEGDRIELFDDKVLAEGTVTKAEVMRTTADVQTIGGPTRRVVTGTLTEVTLKKSKVDARIPQPTYSEEGGAVQLTSRPATRRRPEKPKESLPEDDVDLSAEFDQ